MGHKQESETEAGSDGPRFPRSWLWAPPGRAGCRGCAGVSTRHRADGRLRANSPRPLILKLLLPRGTPLALIIVSFLDFRNIYLLRRAKILGTQYLQHS